MNMEFKEWEENEESKSKLLEKGDEPEKMILWKHEKKSFKQREILFVIQLNIQFPH